MTYNEIVDWLTYRSYEYNRMNNPEIPYFKWRLIFADAIKFEEIYDLKQKEGTFHVINY